MEKKNIALEILEKELEIKNEELKALKKKRFEESQNIKNILIAQYTDFFDNKIPNIAERGFIIELHGHDDGGNIVFKAPHPEVSYNKEVFTIYLEKTKYDQNHVDKVRLNYYTTWGEDDFEFIRLAVMGKVAEVLLDESSKQALLDISNNKPKNSITYSDVWKIEKEYHEIDDQIKALKKEAKFYKFETEGIKFDAITIEYNIGSIVPNCVGMKLVKYTNKNKKTATVEFTRQVRNETIKNGETIIQIGDLYDTRIVNKVRVSKLKQLVNYYYQDVC
jgi:hypothetical protein